MIQISNLAFSYGRNEVLRNITMDLEPGRIYGLLGENGVGKTTLLTLLCGLKKTQSGTISADGHDPYKREPALLRDQYYLPDEVAPVNDRALAWGLAAGRFWPRFDRQKYETVLQEFEVDPVQKMNAMSNGQLKKTYIAFALASGVRFLYLDEPTNGLDIPSKAQFRSALMRHTAEDATIVISTHQVRDLENIIDPIIILDRRDVLLEASIERIAGKLYFDYGTVLRSDSLYSEQLPGGFIQVRPNTEGLDSKVNIEALFNTVHKHKELVKNLFRNE